MHLVIKTGPSDDQNIGQAYIAPISGANSPSMMVETHPGKNVAAVAGVKELPLDALNTFRAEAVCLRTLTR
ncbi:MAG: hypothetical protein E5Y32_11215 [Mesorhizobium sp.]|nr:MAG: hypothetical protein E5Y32_11215 [Mesorhizobium sp.]